MIIRKAVKSEFVFFILTKDMRKETYLGSNVNGTQCGEHKIGDCPDDTCNAGVCDHGCVVGCTKMACFGDQRKHENQLCYVSSNNCRDGLKCIAQNDGCNYGLGRCVKSGKIDGGF